MRQLGKNSMILKMIDGMTILYSTLRNNTFPPPCQIMLRVFKYLWF